MGELGKFVELNDELDKLTHTCNICIKMPAKFDELGKLSKLSWLSYRMSWISWISWVSWMSLKMSKMNCLFGG